MSDRDRLEVLRQVVELSAVSDLGLGSLLRFFDEVSVPRGMTLAQEGELGHEFFVVVSGRLEVCRRGRASRLGPGDAFGWKAMHERGRHDATLVTMSPARLLVMGHSQFRAAEAAALASVRSGTPSAA